MDLATIVPLDGAKFKTRVLPIWRARLSPPHEFAPPPFPPTSTPTPTPTPDRQVLAWCARNPIRVEYDPRDVVAQSHNTTVKGTAAPIPATGRPSSEVLISSSPRHSAPPASLALRTF